MAELSVIVFARPTGTSPDLITALSEQVVTKEGTSQLHEALLLGDQEP